MLLGGYINLSENRFQYVVNDSLSFSLDWIQDEIDTIMSVWQTTLRCSCLVRKKMNVVSIEK